MQYSNFANLPLEYQPLFEPGGRGLVFVREKDSKQELWHHAFEEGQTTKLLEGLTISGVRYRPGSRVLIIAGNTAKEASQVYAVDFDNGLTRLTKELEKPHYLGGISPDGRLVAYSIATDDRVDLYIHDLVSRSAWRLARGNKYLFALDWTSPHVLLSMHIGDAGTAIELRDVRRRQYHILVHSRDSYGSPAITPDETTLYLLSDRESEFDAIWSLDLADLSWTLRTDELWDVEEFRLASDGTQLAYSMNVDGASQLVLQDICSQRNHVLSDIPLGTYGQLTFASQSKTLAFTVDAPTHPSSIWICGPDGRVQPMLKSHSSASAPALVEPTRVHYTSGHLNISAWLYRPTQKQEMSGIIYVHGGPHSQVRANFHRPLQFLAAQGFVVIAPNFRGSSGYGKTFAHADAGQNREFVLEDILACRNYLKEQLNCSAVGLWGFSYGGLIALTLIARFPELWEACVGVSAIADLVTFLEALAPEQRRLREQEYGSLEYNLSFLRQFSPLTYVEDIQAPVLVTHGVLDYRVPISGIDLFVERLRARQHSVHYMRFDDEGHGITKVANQDLFYRAASEFLTRHLKARTHQTS